MKKATSILMIALLCLLSPFATAESPVPFQGEVWDLPFAGLHFDLPQDYENAQGLVFYTGGNEYSYGDGVCITAIWYLGMPNAEANALLRKVTVTDEEAERFYRLRLPIAYIMSIDEYRTAADLARYFSAMNWEEEELQKLDQIDDVSFYLYQFPPFSDADTQYMGDLASEYQRLSGDISLLTGNLTYSLPQDQYAALSGSTISFETVEIDGNPVSSAELFAQNTITMVNIWASWCGPCVREMPELQALSQQYAGTGCAIIGILYDGDDAAAVADAKDILEMTGVTFPILLPWEGIADMYPVQAFPTTLFIDSAGHIVDDPIIGAYSDRYAAVLEKYK